MLIYPAVVVSGSFRRFFEEISRTVAEFERIGVRVLSPSISKIVNPGEEFAVFSTDHTTDVKTLEDRHLDAIRRSDALYLCDPGGYLGASTMMEVGAAIGWGKLVFCKELPQVDDRLLRLCGTVATPEQVRAEILSRYQRT